MKLRSWFTAAILGIATVFVAPSMARADWWDEVQNCLVGHGGVGSTYGGGINFNGGYTYSVLLVTPSNSACEDIQILYYYSNPYWQKYRIRFYPSSGGSYVNSWKYAPSCYPESCYWILATDVANGTYFRVEGLEQVSGCNPPCTEYLYEQPYVLAW